MLNTGEKVEVEMNGRREAEEGSMPGASKPLRSTAGSRMLARSSFYAGSLAVIALGTRAVRTGSIFPSLDSFVWLGLASGVAAIVLGVMGRRLSPRGTAERRFATAGLAIGIGIVLPGILFTAFIVALQIGCRESGCFI